MSTYPFSLKWELCLIMSCDHICKGWIFFLLSKCFWQLTVNLLVVCPFLSECITLSLHIMLSVITGDVAVIYNVLVL